MSLPPEANGLRFKNFGPYLRFLARPVHKAERLLLWCRRKPALAGSLAAAALLLVAAGMMGAVSWITAGKAEQAELQVEREKVVARGEAEVRQRKEEEVRNERQAREAIVYLDDMRKAKRAWEEADFAPAWALLNAYRPRADVVDHRGWEWYYLNALVPGTELKQLCKVASHLGEVAWSPDGQRLAAVLDGENLKIWDAATGQEVLSVRAEKGTGPGLAKLFWSPDGNWLAVIEVDGRVSVLSATNGRKRSTFERKPKVADQQPGRRREAPSMYVLPLSVSWSPDSQRFVTLGYDRQTAVVCDASDGRELHTLGGHIGDVRVALWSQDGKWIITGAGGGTLKVWDAGLGREAFRLPGPDESIDAAAWKPDSQQFATLSHDDRSGRGSTRIWDLAGRKQRLELSAPAERLSMHAGLAWSRDGERLCVYGDTLLVWDAAGGTLLSRSKPGPAGALSGLIAPDFKRFANGDSVGAVETGQVEDAISLPPGRSLTPLGWSQDGSRLAVRIEPNERFRIVNQNDSVKQLLVWTPVREQMGRKGWTVPALDADAWSPDGRRFVAMPSSDGYGRGPLELKMGDPERQQFVPVRSLRKPTAAEPVVLTALSPDGQRLALAYRDLSIQVNDAGTGQVRAHFRRHTEETTPDTQLTALLWEPAGQLIASTDSAGRTWVWDAATGKERFRTDARPRPAEHLSALAAWAFEGKQLVVAQDGSTRLSFLDAATGKETRTLTPGAAVSSIAWRPKHAQLAMLSGETVTLWDSATGQSRVITRQGAGALHWSQDGQILVLGVTGRGVRLWYAADQALGLVPLPIHEGLRQGVDLALRVAWSPDQRFLTLLTREGESVTFEVATGEISARPFPSLARPRDPPAPRQGRTPQPRAMWGIALGWTAAGPRAALVSEQAVEVWDTTKERPTWSQPQAARAQETPAFFREYAWSPDGRRLATLDSENAIRLWDAASGQAVRAIPAPAPGGQRAWIPDERERKRLVWSPDGKRLALAVSTAIEVWDTDSGKHLFRLGKPPAPPAGDRLDPDKALPPMKADDDPPPQPPDAPVLALAWAPDGTRLAASSAVPQGMRVTLWDIATRQETVTVTREMHENAVSPAALAWSRDGRYFALGDMQQVQVWEAPSGLEAFALRGPARQGALGLSCARLTWTADGKRLLAQAAASSDPHAMALALRGTTYTVWDVPSRQEILTLAGPVLSPDGHWLLIGSLLKPVASTAARE